MTKLYTAFAIIDFFIVSMIVAIMCVTHGSARAEKASGNAGASNALNCDQRLIEEIFMCVSKYNVDVTDFLLAVGGINDSTHHRYQNTAADDDISSIASQNISNDNTATNFKNSNSSNNNNIMKGSTDLSSHQHLNLQPTDSMSTESNNVSFAHATSSENISGLKETATRHQQKPVTERIDVRTGNSNTTSKKSRHGDYENHNMHRDRMKEDVCRHQKEVMECAFHDAKALIENPGCAPSAASQSASSDLLVNDQRYRIKSLIQALLGQYDNYCAHECRNNLITDMRTCYEKFDLNANLFMSQESHGAVIGSSAYEAEVFCQNREALVTCLRTKSSQCPESDFVLSAVGLDLEMMDRGFDILCQNQYTYLRSLECFESHTPEVGICHSIKHRRIIAIASLATLEHWTNEKYLHEACRIRLEHIRCDLDAWANKGDGSCDEHILDLKRRLHCSLIPAPCLHTHPTPTHAICKPHSSSSSSSPSAGGGPSQTIGPWRGYIVFLGVLFHVIFQLS